MIVVRRAAERGHFDHGWLNTYHTFSFADYYDPAHMGFRTVRVINEDRVQPGQGFPTHAHRDMEILSYVLEGALQHKDSLGNGSVIRPGEVQRMSAGTGVTHSEYNPSRSEPVHFLQIWILPESRGLAPGYEQQQFASQDLANRWRLLASRDGRDASVTVHQDVQVFGAQLNAGATLAYAPAPGRHAWLQVTRGSVRLNDVALQVSDGAAISEERTLRLDAADDTEMLLFDLP